MDITTSLLIGGFVLQAGGTIFSLGKLFQKVDNMDKRINNGFTCKFHTDVEKEIGHIQGRLDKNG